MSEPQTPRDIHAGNDKAKTFEPSRYLSLVNGNEYLEVKWRLVWFRSECPCGVIETELMSHANSEAIFRAKVAAIGEGGEIQGSATGWGSEDAQSFGDYIEKAETKAIGRALAALGFGTQFCTDFDFGASTGRVVDSPVRRQNTDLISSNGAQQYSTTGGGTSGLEATARQRNLIEALARELKINGPALDELCLEQTGQKLDGLTRKSASAVIEALKGRQVPMNRP